VEELRVPSSPQGKLYVPNRNVAVLANHDIRWDIILTKSSSSA